MKIKSTFIEGCKILEYNQYRDNRGFFQEIYHLGLFKVFNFQPLQINHSFNKKNSLRGIHVAPFTKIVTCISGKILDVCVDLRKESTTYLKYYKIILDNSSQQILIPPNCGHAFLSLEENTSVVYMQDGFYEPSKEVSLRYNSPLTNIDWDINESVLNLSEKDKNASLLLD